MKRTTNFYTVALGLVVFTSIYQARISRAEDHAAPIQSPGSFDEKSLDQKHASISTAALQELRNYSIHYSPPHSHITENKDGTMSFGCVFPTPPKKNYLLARPGEKNSVGALLVTNDAATGNEMFELNADTDYDYGPIPSLENMTRAEADALWGPQPITADSPWGQDGNVCYKLVCRNTNSPGKEFYFFCSFKNGLLTGFRIGVRK